MKATEVFTPGAFPKHTYVARNGAHLEQQLRDSLDTPGLVVSLNGPSKSGKTVLIEKVVGTSGLIPIQGTGLRTPEEIWLRSLDMLGIPLEETRIISGSVGISAGGKAGISGGIAGLISGTGEVNSGITGGLTQSTSTVYTSTALNKLIDNIAESDFVILVDDFHYMNRDVQVEVAKALKEGVRRGLKICTATAVHRADDIVRANPELRGRVKAIDLEYWNAEDLKQIATQGFEKLNVLLPETLISKFVKEAAGSPQLMQSICLQTCLVIGARESFLLGVQFNPNEQEIKKIFEQVTTMADYRSMLDVLDAGPKLRGTERKTYKFINNKEGDVYRCVLGSIALDPPQLSFSYEEITQRTKRFCRNDHPVGSSVSGSCQHMARLAREKFPAELAIDYDEQKQVLDIPNPYFLFYLRWSDRLFED